MHCAVYGCNNSNVKKRIYHHFFGFPKDKALQEEWIKFSQRADEMNVKTARICDVHFQKKDFENLMQFEMGYCKVLLLKPGACPSIAPNQVSSTYVKTRIKKKSTLKKKYELPSTLLEESIDIEDHEELSSEITSSVELEIAEDEFMDTEYIDEITALKQENDRLKNENEKLRKENSLKPEQINNIYLPKIMKLKKQLLRAEYKNQYMEEKLREIFTQEKKSKDFESVWLLTAKAPDK